jgi:TRAP-type transport system periplasmic protein
MRLFKLFFIAPVLALAVGAWNHAYADITLRFSNWDPPTHEVRSMGIEVWAKQVGEVTEGRVKVKILPKPVGIPPAHHDLIRDGAVDAGTIIPSYTPGRFLTHKVVEFPFYTDNAVAQSVAYWRIYVKFFKSAGEHEGLKLLVNYANGPGLIHNNVRPIRTQEDMKGLKLRVSGDSISQLAKAAGATPIFAPITKVNTMLSKGVVDGVFLGAEGVENFKLTKLLKYTTMPKGGLGSTMFQIVVNEKAWNKIPAKDQKLIESVSGEAAARMIGEAWEAAEADGMKTLKAAGYEMIMMEPPLRAKFEKYFKPVLAEWIAGVDKMGIDGKAAWEAYKAEVEKLQ